jgi:hypothetical protein
MKKIKLHLLLMALLGMGAAWVNKPVEARNPIHIYSYRMTGASGTKYYFTYDLTSLGWQEGYDYDCTLANYTCTFMADPIYMQTDFNGDFFYIWNMPSSGIDNSGFFTVD